MPEYSSNAIIEFDALIDSDFGKVRWIRDNIKLPDLDMNVINGDNYFLRVVLYTMPTRDVASAIGMSQSTYTELFKDRKNLRKAFELSPRTTILELSEIYANTGGVINTTVLCKNPLEEHFINRISPKTRTIVNAKYDVDLNRFDVIYIKEFADILQYSKFKRINGKEIIIPEYWYNMDPTDHTKPNMSVALTVSDTNKIKTICPYKNFVLPVEED